MEKPADSISKLIPSLGKNAYEGTDTRAQKESLKLTVSCSEKQWPLVERASQSCKKPCKGINILVSLRLELSVKNSSRIIRQGSSVNVVHVVQTPRTENRVEILENGLVEANRIRVLASFKAFVGLGRNKYTLYKNLLIVFSLIQEVY